MSIVIQLAAFLYLMPLVIGLWRDVKHNQRYRKRGARVAGVLVGFAMPEGRRRHGPGAPVAAYVVDGKVYRVNDNGNVVREGPFRGRRMMVCYDPDNPADAIISRPFDAAEPVLLVLLCVGEAILIVSAVIALLHLMGPL